MTEDTLVNLLIDKKLKITTAESCTGGMIGMCITRVSGSSQIYDGGVISYANKIKHELLGVSDDTLNTFGAVSPECAEEMVTGAKKLFCADVAVAVTGIAGPLGGTPEKPVGLVYIAACYGENLIIEKCNFKGDRQDIRKATCERAMNLVIKLINRQ